MSLLVWLPLNGSIENQGLAGDIKIIGGTATIADNGKIGKCYSFIKTSNQYLMGAPAPLNNDINEWSYACWFKPTDVHNGCLLSNRTATNTTGIALFYYNNQFLFDDGIRWQFTPTIRIAPGVWNHIVCVRKKGVGKYLYVNGVLSNSTTVTGTPAIATSPYFSIGNSQNGNTSTSVSGNPLNGLLNDVRIYDHALSKKEVEELSKGLVMHYKLDSKFEQPIVKNLIKNLVSGGQTTISNSTKIITSGVNKDTYFQFDITEGLVEGEKYTIQCDVSSPLDNDVMVWQFGVTGQNTGINMPMYNGHNEFTWVCPTAAAGKTRIMMDDNGGRARANTAVTEIYNFQIEKSDHAGALIPFNSTYENNQILDSSGYLRHGIIKDNNLNFVFDSKRYSQCMQNNVEANSTIYPFIAECNIPNSDALTFSWWMKPTKWGKQNSGIFSTSNNIYATDYQATAANMRDSYFDCTNTTGTCKRIQASDAVTLNEWHHYVLKYDGEYLSLYKDGKIFKSGTNERKVAQTGELKGFKYFIPFYSKAGGANRAMSGSLSDFRVYVTALSDEQIEELYNVSVTIDNNGNIYPRELVEK